MSLVGCVQLANSISKLSWIKNIEKQLAKSYFNYLVYLKYEICKQSTNQWFLKIRKHPAADLKDFILFFPLLKRMSPQGVNRIASRLLLS